MITSYLGRRESSLFKKLQVTWIPAFAGMTTFYDCIRSWANTRFASTGDTTPFIPFVLDSRLREHARNVFFDFLRPHLFHAVPSLAAGLLSIFIRYCWPILNRLFTSQYRTSPEGKFKKKKV